MVPQTCKRPTTTARDNRLARLSPPQNTANIPRPPARGLSGHRQADQPRRGWCTIPSEPKTKAHYAVPCQGGEVQTPQGGLTTVTDGTTQLSSFMHAHTSFTSEYKKLSNVYPREQSLRFPSDLGRARPPLGDRGRERERERERGKGGRQLQVGTP